MLSSAVLCSAVQCCAVLRSGVSICIHLFSHFAYLISCLFSCQVEENFLAHAQMKELGLQADTNLFEMAGCLLRLVMWPTGGWNSEK